MLFRFRKMLESRSHGKTRDSLENHQQVKVVSYGVAVFKSTLRIYEKYCIPSYDKALKFLSKTLQQDLNNGAKNRLLAKFLINYSVKHLITVSSGIIASYFSVTISIYIE